jgi:hypothetical protein
MKLNYDTDPIVLSFSKKSLTQFLDKLVKLIEYECEHTSKQEEQEWKRTWETWKTKGLATATSRKKITEILLGLDYKNNTHKASQTMERVVGILRNTIPIIKDTVEFTKSINDPERWQITFPNTTTVEEYHKSIQVILPDNQPEQTWSEVISGPSGRINRLTNKDDDETNSMPSIDADSKSSLNRYDALAETQMDDDNDDQLLSYDETTIDDNNAPIEPPTTIKKSNKSTNLIKNILSDDNEDHQPEINILTEDELITATEFVKNNNITDSNITLIVRWILSTAVSLEDTYNEKIQSLDKEIDKTRTIVENDLKDNKKSLTVYATNTIKSMNDDLSKITTTARNIMNDCDGKIKAYNKNVRTLKRNLITDESNIISKINAAGNVNKAEIEELNESVKTNITLLQSSNTIGATSIQSINQLTKDLKSQIRDTYATYEEDIMALADNQKDEYSTWLDERSQQMNVENKLIEEMRKESAQCRAERLLLKMRENATRQSYKKWKKH